MFGATRGKEAWRGRETPFILRTSIFDRVKRRLERRNGLQFALVDDQSSLEKLNEKVKRISPSLSVLHLFARLREKWLEGTGKEERAFFENVGISIPMTDFDAATNKALGKIAREEGLDWSDLSFHLKNRVHSFDALERIAGRRVEGSEGLRGKYLLSVLPLNLLLRETLEKFVPSPDYFALHATGTVDPYGIWMKGAVVKDENGNYLASRKFDDVVLANIIETCPIGCTSCYKAPLTREASGEVRVGVKLKLDEKRVLAQTKKLVEWLNRHAEVSVVVLSGGEPLMYSNGVWRKILEELKNAKHLRVVRVCTATIFQGLPFRVDKELLGILEKFSRETGKRVAFNTHISHSSQFTPEALLAVKRIKQAGFDILLQMPIQKGVNFFVENAGDEEGKKKTIEEFERISRMANAAGVQNYKWIVDMHPRTQKHVVSIEALVDLLCVFEQHKFSDMTRPNYVELLCRQGNVYLNRHLISSASSKIVYHELGLVVYFITPDGKNVVLHREPLLEGMNDSEENKFDPDYETLFANAREAYEKELLPLENEMRRIAADESLSVDLRRKSFEVKRLEFEEKFDECFPPIVRVGVE